MLYTPLQYRKLEHQFLQEFDYKTIDNQDEEHTHSNLIQYKNILNLITINKQNNFNKKKQLLYTKRKQHTSSKLFTKRRQLTEDNEKYDQADNGMFLTQNNILQYDKQLFTPVNSSVLKNSQIKQQKSQQQSESLKKENQLRSTKLSLRIQIQEIEQVYDRICGQYSVLQSLKHQQEQVQEAIYCFKKRKMEIRKYLSSQELKIKDVDKILVENKNQMIKAKQYNEKIKYSYERTKKHFNLDFEGKKHFQISIQSKNKNQFEEAIINNICLRKMKVRILEQQEQIKFLDRIKQEFQQKQNKYKDIYVREKQLLQAYEGIIEARNYYNQINQQIVSILDKDFQELEKTGETNKETTKIVFKKTERSLKKSKNVTKDVINEEQLIKQTKQLKKMVDQIVMLYDTAKQQQVSLIGQFKRLIGQKKQFEEKFNQINIKLTALHQNIDDRTSYFNQQPQKVQLQKKQSSTKKIIKKINFLNNSLYSLQDRLKYFLIRHVIAIKKIIELWLGSDENSKKFIEYFLQRVAQLGLSTEQGTIIQDNKSLTTQQTKIMLMNSFGKWQKYLIYIDILHQNSFVYRYLNQNMLQNFFKRIIKTKKTNKILKTDDIFQKGIYNIFDSQRKDICTKLSDDLRLFKQFYGYLKMVNKGEIKLNVVFNYDILNGQTEMQIDEDKLQSEEQIQPGENQIKMSSHNKIEIKNQNNWKFLPSIEEKDRKSFAELYQKQKKTKKKTKGNKKTLNLHEFYEDLKNQIQKVKVSY